MVLERETEHSGDRPPESLHLACPVIETGRLLLRPPHLSDAQDIAAEADNYRVAAMLASMPDPYFVEDAREFIAKLENSPAGACVYAITRAADGAFMGICGLHEDRARFELPFIGYWLGESHWGHGYATEAACALTDLFFKVTDRPELMISCRVDNPASRRVIAKCGGRFWKTGEQYNRALGETQSLEHYRVTRASRLSELQRSDASAGLGVSRG